MMGSIFLMLVAIPVGAVFINGVEYPLAVTEMDISVLYIEAMSAITIFGIFMVAYGSNNKYSLLGAFRNFARMVGYEVPLGITVVSVAVMTGSLNIVDISRSQGMLWNIFLQPLGCFVFFVALMADMGRLPFDQNESEEELIAGWITEYCGMRFGLSILCRVYPYDSGLFPCGTSLPRRLERTGLCFKQSCSWPYCPNRFPDCKSCLRAYGNYRAQVGCSEVQN